MRSTLWLRGLLTLFCLATLPGDPPQDLLYPGIRTREAILRGSFPPFNTAAEAQLRTCHIAAQPIPEDLPFTLFEDDIQVIASYKKSWLKICTGRDQAALAEAYGLAQQLEAMLRDPLFSNGLPKTDDRRSPERLDHIYRRLDVLDQFVPAFYGSAEVYEFYAKNRTLFYLFALNGTADDRNFFKIHYQYHRQGLVFPWIEQTWAQGGCTRFGEYAWLTNLQDLLAAMQQIRHPVYLQTLYDWQTALFYEFKDLEEKPTLCVCDGGHEDVLADAEAVQLYAAARPDLRPEAEQVAKLIDALKSGRKRVLDYGLDGCPY